MSKIKQSTKPSHRVKLIDTILAGSISGASTAILLQPLETIKTNKQLLYNLSYSNNPSANHFRNYKTILSALNNKLFVSQLWNGTAPSLFRIIPGVSIYFSVLEGTYMLLRTNDISATKWHALFIGAGARAFTSTITMPITVVKTRYESGLFRYSSVAKALSHIYYKEGLRGLYSGYLATVLRDTPYAGVYFFIYWQLKEQLIKNVNSEKLSFSHTFIAALISGFTASIATHPFDVIKTRLQVNILSGNPIGLTFSKIILHDGPRGLLVGLTLRLTRKMLSSAFNWTFYESLMFHIKSISYLNPIHNRNI